ncbi:transporter [Salidesulfovibrio onnuriiensis]|uniref:transporter n=1 Tax=Salidesulfovibrio onnuriiensis TaxID=2583823 RepID=UPI0011CA274D|nr:transporter [Salidesulfovibrio onnuriiensis]
MKQSVTAAVFLALGILAAGWHAAYAGPVMGGGEESEQQLKDKPDTKPVRCIGPVNMSNGLVLPKGKVAASIKYKYVHKNNLYDGGNRKTGNYNGKYDRVNQTMQLTAKAGIFDNFEARIMVPFHDKRLKRKFGNPPEHADTDELTGLGDIVVMGRYAVMSERDGDWLSLAFGAGLKMPTGDPDHKNPAPFSNVHEYIGPGGQLGTGSWDPKFELGATKFFGRSRVDAHCMYTIPGDGAHGSRKGNQFKYDLGYGYALNRLFDVELELNGVDQQAHWYDHSSTVNTGGHTIYLTPGVHWKISDKCHFSIGTPFVVYRDLNGEAATPERASKYCLGEDFQVVSRLGFSF